MIRFLHLVLFLLFSGNFDKLQTFGERIDKLQYFIAELRNEYKEIKHKAGDIIIHKNKSDLPKQIEKTDEYKDIRNNRVEIINGIYLFH